MLLALFIGWLCFATIQQPAAGAACCSWDNCGACGQTTDYCKSEANCASCKGKWCPNGAQGASGYDMPNVCDPNGAPAGAKLAYACMDWNVGSAAMINAAVKSGMNGTHLFGVGSFGGDGTNMGKCFEITFSSSNQRKGLFQVVNQGGDVANQQFDLQMGDGGFGVFNGCAAPTSKGMAPMFDGDKSAFGANYGGWTHKADCAKLPAKPKALSALPPGEPSLNRLCELSFELGVRIEGGVNPTITSATRVACPAPLVALTGLNRTDEAMIGTEAEAIKSTGSGQLTRMMDCCKPSAGWATNIKNPDPKHPAVIPCTADGYTRVTIGPAPAPGPAPGPDPATPTPAPAVPTPAPPVPTPPAPAPPTPTPAAPTPATPSGCPGGSLSACIGLCPSNPAPAYKACVTDCTHRCA